MSYTDYSTPSGVDEYQRRQDNDHLNLLAIFYYIMGGLTALGALGIGAYFALFGVVFSAAASGQGPGHEQPPAFLGGFFIVAGVVAFLLTALVAGLTIYAGMCLQQKKNSTLIYVAAALNCLHVPLGTALGIFTFIVMSRPSVKALFDGSAAMAYTPRDYRDY